MIRKEKIRLAGIYRVKLRVIVAVGLRRSSVCSMF